MEQPDWTMQEVTGSPEDRFMPGAVSVLQTLAVCGVAGGCYASGAGALFVVVLFVAALVAATATSPHANLGGEVAVAGVVAVYAVLMAFPSGVVAGIAYGALGTRWGAVFAGFLGAVTLPFTLSLFSSMTPFSAPSHETLGLEIPFGLPPLVIAPALGWLFHQAAQRGNSHWPFAGRVRWALGNSALARWPARRRAAFGIALSLLIAALLAASWVLLTKG